MHSAESPSPEIAIVEVAACRVAMVRKTVPLSGIPRAQREARALLETALKAAEIDVGGRTLTVWRPPQLGLMDYAPAVFAPDTFRASGAVSLFTLPQGRAGHLRMRGSYAGLPEAWGRLFAGIASRDLVPAGLNWEVYAAADTSPEAAETDLYAFLT